MIFMRIDHYEIKAEITFATYLKMRYVHTIGRATTKFCHKFNK